MSRKSLNGRVEGVFALFLATVACSSSQPSPTTTSLVLSARPESARAAARESGCPPVERLGYVTDMSATFGDDEPRVMFAGRSPDLDPEQADLSDSRPMRELSDAEAARLGVVGGSDPVWVFPDASRAGCALAPRRHWLVMGKEIWEKAPLVVTELDGDCELSSWEGRLAARQPREPSGCELSRPSDASPVLVRDGGAPRELSAAFAGEGCSDTCDLRESVSGFSDERGRRLEWTVVAHVFPRPGVDECGWEKDDFYGLLAREGNGPVLSLDAYGLDAVLVQHGAIVSFVDADAHRADLWTWPDGAAPRLVHTVQFGWVHDEDKENLALSPYCGP